jgi:hypothetical protein
MNVSICDRILHHGQQFPFPRAQGALADQLMQLSGGLSGNHLFLNDLLYQGLQGVKGV